MREVVIVSAVRTPVGKAYKGTLRATRPDDLAAFAIKGALERVPQLDPKEIEDVILGCAMPEAEQGMNVARIASLRAGLPIEASAMTINRFCSSGLQAIAQAALVDAGKSPASSRASLINAPGKGVYPISSYSWIYVPAVAKDPQRGRAVAEFLKWTYGSGQIVAEQLVCHSSTRDPSRGCIQGWRSAIRSTVRGL